MNIEPHRPSKPHRGDAYVNVIYDAQERPFTSYPGQLTRYLCTRFNIERGLSILDVGCGRGEFLKGFIDCGLIGYGIDQSGEARRICPGADITRHDIGRDPLPYADDFFDIIFSKSVLEHFYYPEHLVQEIFRITKPGGRVITMVPDWEAVYKTFYDDHTHRTPFTKISLRDLMRIIGFTEVTAYKFRQLPILWRFPFLLPVSVATAFLLPRRLGRKSKFIRFSKELMLLSHAVKPVQ